MKKFIYIVIFVVFAAIVAGFFLINSPTTERAARFDEQRVSDLQNIQYQIIYYWQAKQKLPSALSELVDPTRGVSVPVDPETSAAYGYSAKGPLEFSLCANFSRASDGGAYALPLTPPIPVKSPYPVESSWAHDPGTFCFDRNIDTAFYPHTK